MSLPSYKIIFMGTPDFAVPSLEALIEGPDEVIAVVTQPDRPRGRGKKLMPPPVKCMAEKAGIPVLQPKAIKTTAFHEELEALEPDLFVVAAYGRILPGSLLNLPPLGTINVHGSLLPLYRGAAPIQWAVINGDNETGVTIMQMDEGMDTGDILLQTILPIEQDDTAGELFIKMAELGSSSLLEALDRLRQNDLPPQKQDESLATDAPLLNKKMGHLDWNRPACELHSLIRGLDPWPCSFGFLVGKRYRFFSPEIEEGEVSEKPGTISRVEKKGLVIATGEQYLRIREIQPDGKKRMSVQACLCGTSFSPGDIFT